VLIAGENQEDFALPLQNGRGVVRIRKCRVRRAFRRTFSNREGDLPGLWCVQKAKAPYAFSWWNQRSYVVTLMSDY
jgi:hypothetical protein